MHCHLSSSDLRESWFSRFFFEISLLNLDLDSSHFYFTFISWKEWKGKEFHPFFSRKKSEIWHQVSLKKWTIRGGCKTPKKVLQEWFLNVMEFLSDLHRYQPCYGQFMVIWGMWSTLLCHNSCGQYIITWKQLYCRTTQNLWNITGELHWGISECDQCHTGRDRLSRGQEQVTLWNVRRKSWQGCITREYNTCVLIVFTTRLASTDLTSFLFVLAWRE